MPTANQRLQLPVIVIRDLLVETGSSGPTWPSQGLIPIPAAALDS
jgi:hypothetical protein